MQDIPGDEPKPDYQSAPMLQMQQFESRALAERNDLFASKELKRAKKARASMDDAVVQSRCCGLCLLSHFYIVTSTAIVCFDLLQCGIMAYLIFLFVFNTDDKHFTESYLQSSTQHERQLVEDRFIVIMLPIVSFLFYKTFMGVRWVVLGFTRPAMQTFYLVSWAYYSAYFIEGLFVLLCARHVFNDTFKGLMSYSIAICVPLWIMLNLHIRYLDKQNRNINQLRKGARQDQNMRQLQYEADLELIAYHQSKRYSEALNLNAQSSADSPSGAIQAQGNQQQQKDIVIPMGVNFSQKSHNMLEQSSRSDQFIVGSTERELKLQQEVQNYADLSIGSLSNDEDFIGEIEHQSKRI